MAVSPSALKAAPRRNRVQELADRLEDRIDRELRQWWNGGPFHMMVVVIRISPELLEEVRRRYKDWDVELVVRGDGPMQTLTLTPKSKTNKRKGK